MLFLSFPVGPGFQDLSAFLKIQFVENIKKNRRWDPIVPPGFVSYVKKGVNERGTICTNLDAFPFAGPVIY